MNQSAKPPFTSANFKQMLLISSPIVTAETWQHLSAFGVSASLKFIRCRLGTLSAKMRYFTKAFCPASPTWVCVRIKCWVQFHRIHRLFSQAAKFALYRPRKHRLRLSQSRSRDFYSATGIPIFFAALKVFFWMLYAQDTSKQPSVLRAKLVRWLIVSLRGLYWPEISRTLPLIAKFRVESWAKVVLLWWGCV